MIDPASISQQLRDLPQLHPPGECWQKVTSRLETTRAEKRSVSRLVQIGAIAACLTLALTTGALFHQESQAELKSLRLASSLLEAELQQQNPQHWRGDQALLWAQLQDTMYALDAQLADHKQLTGSRSKSLWKLRIQVMMQMLDLREDITADRMVI